ncbi:MAG: gluconate permease [Cyclobacteriaceae bacterium]|nr:MAG: gluconate permease [Cyclobacteriaceae bacterium]
MSPIVLLILGIAVVVICILWLKIDAILALLFAAILVSVLTPEANLLQYAESKMMSAEATNTFINQSIGKRIAANFGSTAAKIGILIAMASIIGTCLLRSGSADRVIRSALKFFGEKKAPAAFLTSGFTLGIPVFFDTVFYLMVPLTKALTLRVGKNYLFYLTATVAGAAMAHSLVPPTPGPLFVAGELGVELGVMIIGGLVVGLFTITAGYLYAAWANKRWTIPLRDTGDVSLEELNVLMNKDDHELPPLWLALTPIILPLILISANTVAGVVSVSEAGTGMKIFKFLGDSNIALTLSAVVSLAILISTVSDKGKIKKFILEALQSAGVIILITCMGGAFGGSLQQTGIGSQLQALATDYQMAILPLAFFITSLMRTAQGSATVGMITAVGIIGGMVDTTALDFHPVYLALMIGCGSKPFPWMNDSGFWVVCKMSGMTEKEALKTFSTVLGIMGYVGMIVIIILAKLFPLV